MWHLLADQTPPPSDFSAYQSIVVILVGFLFLYFILWRPEQKRRKELEEQRASLKVGDQVVAVGIIGKVEKLSDQTAVLSMCDGAKIEVLKAAISEKWEPSKEGADKAL